MGYRLRLFPKNASFVMAHDKDHINRSSVPDVHPAGPECQSVEFPEGLPNRHGCSLVVTIPGKNTFNGHGILSFNDGILDYPWTPGQEAAFEIDVFNLADEKICPELPPIPPIPPTPIPGSHPIDIINGVYATGMYNLATKEGCGMFTEACCKRLHETHSVSWGHVKKSGAQNQFNGHAVDAIQLLVPTPDCEAFLYDIITKSESTDARPALNVAGSPEPSLFLYPPKPI